MKEYFKRVLTSWPTWTGTLIAMAIAFYGVGILLGYWSLPEEMWQQVIGAVTVILAGVYKLFTIGNNPTDKLNY